VNPHPVLYSRDMFLTENICVVNLYLETKNRLINRFFVYNRGYKLFVKAVIVLPNIIEYQNWLKIRKLVRSKLFPNRVFLSDNFLQIESEITFRHNAQSLAIKVQFKLSSNESR